MDKFLLLSTAGCHLCEEAELVLQGFNLSIELIDIAEQTEWQEDYAVRIPVLYHPQTKLDLGWPFDVAAVQVFIRSLGVKYVPTNSRQP